MYIIITIVIYVINIINDIVIAIIPLRLEHLHSLDGK